MWNVIEVNSKNVSDFNLLSLLLTFNRFHTFYGVSISDFEQVNAGSINELWNGICFGLEQWSFPTCTHTHISPPELFTFNWLAISN